MKYLSSTFTILISLISISLKAEFIDSQYVMQTSSQYFRQQALSVVNEFFKKPSITIKSLSFGTEPKLELNQMTVSLTNPVYELGQSELDQKPGALSFKVSHLQAQIQIGEIKVDQIIEQRMGSVRARLRIFALCRGAVAQVDGNLSYLKSDVIPVLTGSELKAQLFNTQVFFENPQVQITNLQCEGAQGFDSYLKTELQTLLQNSSHLSMALQNEYMNQLNQELSKLKVTWNQPQLLLKDSRFQAWVFPQAIEFLENGEWLSRGIIRFNFIRQNYQITASEKELVNPVLRFTKIPKLLSDQTELVLPENTVLEVVRAYLNPQYWTSIYHSSESSEFKKLMKSRFKQFFVWTDLMNFSKSTDFLFQNQLQSTPQISWAESSVLSVKAQVLSHMLAPIKGTYKPFMNFNIPVNTLLKVEIINNELKFSPSNLSLSLNYQWAPGYCEIRESNCGYFSKKRFTKAIGSYLNSTGFSFPLPLMEPLMGLKIQAQKIENHPEEHYFAIHFDEAS